MKPSADTSVRRKTKKRAAPLHRAKKIVISGHDRSQRSLLSHSYLGTTGYRRKIQGLLLNNRALAQALEIARCDINTKDNLILELQKRLTLQTPKLVKMKIQAMGKLMQELVDIMQGALILCDTDPANVLANAHQIESISKDFDSIISSIETPCRTFNVPLKRRSLENELRANRYGIADMTAITEVSRLSDDPSLPPLLFMEEQEENVKGSLHDRGTKSNKNHHHKLSSCTDHSQFKVGQHKESNVILTPDINEYLNRKSLNRILTPLTLEKNVEETASKNIEKLKENCLERDIENAQKTNGETRDRLSFQKMGKAEKSRKSNPKTENKIPKVAVCGLKTSASTVLKAKSQIPKYIKPLTITKENPASSLIRRGTFAVSQNIDTRRATFVVAQEATDDNCCMYSQENKLPNSPEIVTIATNLKDISIFPVSNLPNEKTDVLEISLNTEKYSDSPLNSANQAKETAFPQGITSVRPLNSGLNFGIPRSPLLHLPGDVTVNLSDDMELTCALGQFLSAPVPFKDVSSISKELPSKISPSVSINQTNQNIAEKSTNNIITLAVDTLKSPVRDLIKDSRNTNMYSSHESKGKHIESKKSEVMLNTSFNNDTESKKVACSEKSDSNDSSVTKSQPGTSCQNLNRKSRKKFEVNYNLFDSESDIEDDEVQDKDYSPPKKSPRKSKAKKMWKTLKSSKKKAEKHHTPDFLFFSDKVKKDKVRSVMRKVVRKASDAKFCEPDIPSNDKEGKDKYNLSFTEGNSNSSPIMTSIKCNKSETITVPQLEKISHTKNADNESMVENIIDLTNDGIEVTEEIPINSILSKNSESVQVTSQKLSTIMQAHNSLHTEKVYPSIVNKDKKKSNSLKLKKKYTSSETYDSQVKQSKKVKQSETVGSLLSSDHELEKIKKIAHDNISNVDDEKTDSVKNYPTHSPSSHAESELTMKDDADDKLILKKTMKEKCKKPKEAKPRPLKQSTKNVDFTADIDTQVTENYIKKGKIKKSEIHKKSNSTIKESKTNTKKNITHDYISNVDGESSTIKESKTNSKKNITHDDDISNVDGESIKNYPTHLPSSHTELTVKDDATNKLVLNKIIKEKCEKPIENELRSLKQSTKNVNLTTDIDTQVTENYVKRGKIKKSDVHVESNSTTKESKTNQKIRNSEKDKKKVSIVKKGKLKGDLLRGAKAELLCNIKSPFPCVLLEDVLTPMKNTAKFNLTQKANDSDFCASSLDFSLVVNDKLTEDVQQLNASLPKLSKDSELPEESGDYQNNTIEDEIRNSVTGMETAQSIRKTMAEEVNDVETKDEVAEGYNIAVKETSDIVVKKNNVGEDKENMAAEIAEGKEDMTAETSEDPDRRRRRTQVSYKEPSLSKKLRRGDQLF